MVPWPGAGEYVCECCRWQLEEGTRAHPGSGAGSPQGKEIRSARAEPASSFEKTVAMESLPSLYVFP